jgi:predicted ATPase/DNA-binding SARP family transcriptional activator/GAF domain-containing protein
MSNLALFLLGPPRIECDGEPVEIRRRKALALLVYLAVTRQGHSRDALATLFWPELDHSRARAGLRRALAALKKALGEGWADDEHPLDVDRETVGLNPSAGIWLDVIEFQGRLAECRTHGHPQDRVCPACPPLLAEAAALYRDDFLAGFTLPDSPAFDEWQFFQTEGLRDALASALERLARGYSDRGEFEQAIAYARHWLSLDPLHEPAHRLLMRLYAWSGQRAAALRQYAECERVLEEELDISPEEETAQVYQAIKERRELPPPGEVHRRAERLAVVNRIARAVGTTLDLDDVFETVYREINSVFQADDFCIALHDEETDELGFLIQVCEGVREPPGRQPLGTGLISLVVTGGKPVLVGDLEQEQDRLPTPQAWRTPKLPASWLGVPMLAGGRVIGVICVQAYHPYVYGEEEQLLLSTIAEQVTVVIENACLLQAEREQRELAEALEEVAAAASGMLDLEQVLDCVLEQVERVVGGDAFNLMLVEDATAWVVCWRGYEHLGMEDRISRLTILINDYPHLVRMTQSGKPVVIPDTAAEPDWVLREGWEWLRSYVGAPLRVRGQTVGFLNVDGSRPGQFGPADAERLVAFTDHAAAAIENARLFQYAEQLEQAGRHAVPISPQPSAHKHNLPLQPTPFVGRKAVLAEIADRLQDPDCQLLTLVGPGGSGKTRLALEVGVAQLDNYTHGVWFVSLAPLQSVDAIVPTVAQALEFRFYEEGEPWQQLLDYLRQKSLLLIMDNYEHLLDGTDLVTEILKTAPDVKVLATSRARLNVGGEHRFQITGMDFPELTPSTSADAIQYSAVKLFLQGARRAQPGFELTDENLGGVVDVCRVAEGMPLAIRLAAAWVEMLTPAEIAVETSQGIDFLETGLRDVPERQRSVRAIFDHSWKLLAEREREVFQALSAFRGGFTREAAQEVAGASLRELRILVDKSLLHRTPAGWYEVHGLLRQYAAEKLAATPAAWETTHDRHCAYYAAALQQWDTDLRSSAANGPGGDGCGD